jgi:transposase-like protein
MNKHKTTPTRPPVETLACINEDCELHRQKGQGNLRVRKTYGKDGIRYLRCQWCGAEFSERKGSALWNTKVSEVRAIAVAEHLAEGCSLKATARLVKVDPSVVRRLNRKAGRHGEAFHDERVQGLRVKALEGDERHGYVHDKGRPQWEAELIDPESKFIVSHVQGKRDEILIRRLLEDGAGRLANRHELVLLTDGDASYATLFPQIFGQAYRPARHGNRGRLPNWCYRIPRTLAHVQVIKHRQSRRLVDTEIRYTHGSLQLVSLSSLPAFTFG